MNDRITFGFYTALRILSDQYLKCTINSGIYNLLDLQGITYAHITSFHNAVCNSSKSGGKWKFSNCYGESVRQLQQHKNDYIASIDKFYWNTLVQCSSMSNAAEVCAHLHALHIDFSFTYNILYYNILDKMYYSIRTTDYVHATHLLNAYCSEIEAGMQCTYNIMHVWVTI